MASKDAEDVPTTTEKPAVETLEEPPVVGPNDVKVKEINVQSVELADAIAKDKPNYWSRSQISLFCFMLFATLSKSHHRSMCLHPC